MSVSTATVSITAGLRVQLLDRRQRLQSAARDLDHVDGLVRLLEQVDGALSRLESSTFGECAVCLGRIDGEELSSNPLSAYCLCELSAERQRALEKDLQLAWRVQAALLPDPDLSIGRWTAHYRYLPFGPVSGDYCDLIPSPAGDGALYFFLGDVSGKGVAASLLMSHLHAAFRAYVQTGLPLAEMVERASGLLAEKSLTTHYATLICGRAEPDGGVEMVNAGHCAPLVLRASGEPEALPGGGLPIGLALAERTNGGYATHRVALSGGDSVVLHTDGLTEAVNPAQEDYGAGRLASVLMRCADCGPRDLVSACLRDLDAFLNGAPREDDITVLALHRA
jgi:sigma-B regulation protein RsbU (phosphoserine phosphatase)